jgi:tetratricopeptide (TPR) repeat protein
MRQGVKAALIAAAGAAVMVPVVQVTVAGVFRTRDPSLVRRVAPFDALTAAALAYRMVAQGGTSNLAEADALAASALRRDPSVSLAAVARGLIADQRGNHSEARRWFSYADRLSKRDLATQLWFIEEQVKADDVPGVLARYDLALRATPSASALLFPIMTQAASDPEIATHLNALLRTRPAWGSEFISYLISKSNDPQAIVRITTGVIDRDPVNGRDQLTAMVGSLVSKGEYALAWRAYQAFGRIRTAAVVRDGSFSDTAPVSAFEWSYPDTISLLPEHGQEGGKPVLYIPADPDRDGEAVKQLVKLGGGEWTFSAKIGPSSQPITDAPRVRIVCANAGASTLLDLPFAQSAAASTLTGTFTAAATCAYAWISIAVRQPSEPASGTGPWITDVSLRAR